MSNNRQNTPQPSRGNPPAAPSADRATSAVMADDADSERVARHLGAEDRAGRDVSEDAARSELSDLLSDDDFEALVRDQFEQTALPTPPAMPGYHLCWLTTTSQYDSLQKRHRIGYRPVRRSELPDFRPQGGQQVVSDFADYVTCNEMVLHKIPEQYYQRMMQYFHHKRPAEDVSSLVQKIQDKNAEKEDSSGRKLGEILGDGLLNLEESGKRDRRLPTFS